MTKKDVERHLCILDKTHQTSVMLGIELLAKYNYDMALLAEKRAGCQNIERDVEVCVSGVGGNIDRYVEVILYGGGGCKT